VSAFLAPFLGTTAWGDVHLVVAADGSGQYSRIQDAIAAIPTSPTTPYILDIKPGTYTMTHNMDQFKVTQSNVTFNGLGASPSDVVITGSYGSDELPNDKYCHATTVILGSNFTARNVTFANTHGDNNGQALAMYAKADRLFFLNCRFLGWQDTLRTEYGRQYFKNCYVEGDVDFIYGHATAFFDNCSLYVKSNGYITAPALLEPANDYRSKGFVFYQCTITGVGTGIGYLGRPWTAGGLAVYDSCWIGPVINKAGWTGNLDGSYFAEHHSMDLNGNLLNVSNRIAGSYQLTDTQALAYSKSNWISGPDNWTPVDNTEPDTTAPTPNPMTWASDPVAAGTDSITMTATTATDASGVQYFFDCLTAGGHDSGWQDSATYVDTGLSPDTSYSYQVKARDKSINLNETDFSTALSATTLPLPQIGVPAVYWPFDETGGTVVHDVSGSPALSGTLLGTPLPSWVSGKYGNSVFFSDLTQSIYVPHSAAIDFTTESFSVSVWARQPVSYTGQYELFLKGTTGSGAWPGSGKRYELYRKDTTFRFCVDDDVVKTEIQVPVTDICTGDWVHIVAVRDTAADQLKLYVNGSPVSSIADSTGSITQTEPLYIGWAMSGGAVDDLRIYRYALSSDEIMEIYLGYGVADYFCTEPMDGDLDGDCQVDLFDLALFAEAWLGGDLLADLTGDNTIDFRDMARLAQDWMACNREPSTKCWQ